MKFYKKEQGQGMVEYALIIVLIAIAVIAAVTFFGESLSTTYNDIVNNLAAVIN
jgi:pilus assembly protein Flp/PilA